MNGDSSNSRRLMNKGDDRREWILEGDREGKFLGHGGGGGGGRGGVGDPASIEKYQPNTNRPTSSNQAGTPPPPNNHAARAFARDVRPLVGGEWPRPPRPPRPIVTAGIPMFIGTFESVLLMA